MTKWIEMGGRRLRVEIADSMVTVDGVAYEIDLRELEPGVLSLLSTDGDGRTRSFRCTLDGDAVRIDGERIGFSVYDPRSLHGLASAIAATGPKTLRAPMPGRVVRVLVAEGETVAAGQGCVVIEAMKMQNELKAPQGGVVRRLSARVAETVASGAVLLVVE